MTPKEAAKIIGCNVSHVRNLIRIGILNAECYAMPGGFYYDLDPKNVCEFAKTPQTRGYPRGKKRNPKNESE